MPRTKETVWSRLGVQRRPGSVSDLLGDVANITVATGHRYVWRGIKDAHYTLHSALDRRLRTSGVPVTREALREQELALLKTARDSRLGDPRLMDAELLALLQHAGASTPLLDVTPDPFVALFFATEPVGEIQPCALVAIRVPGATAAEQRSHTHKGPLGNGNGGVYDRLCSALALPQDSTAPILWECPFVDDRMRAQRGMFLATTAEDSPVSYASFDPGVESREAERSHVDNLCKRSRGNYTRPALVVFYISAKLREQAIRELDQRFGYRTETIYPDLSGFALANAPTRNLNT
jgi:hypothetical protein